MLDQAAPKSFQARKEIHVAGALFVALTVAAWLLIPPAYSVYKVGTPAVFRFFLQDTFYYFSVAAHSATGFYTFDGELATSGFHPLWQIYLTELFKPGGPADQELQIRLAFYVSVLLTVIGYVFLSLALYIITDSKLLSLLIIPGLMNLLFWGVLQFAHSPWSYMNGMESPLTVLFAGVLFTVIASQRLNPDERATKLYLATGLILSLLVLSRLDDVFLAPAMALASIAANKDDFRRCVLNTAALILPSVVLLMAYVLFNHHSTGAWLPISGTMKGGLSVWENLGYVYKVFSLQFFRPDNAPVVEHISALYRLVQLFFPMIAAALFLVALSADYKKNVFLIGLLGYVILKGLYNFVNVNFDFQGVVWYYTLSVITINVVAIILLSRVYRQYSPSAWFKAVGTCAVAFVLLVHLNFITMIPMQGKTLEYNFWNSRVEIKSALKQRDPQAKLVEYDDGIINFSLGIPAIHGLGFVLDTTGARAKSDNRFLEYCLGRGFNVISSLAYVRLPKEGLSSAQIEAYLRRTPYLGQEDLSAFNFDVIYVHKPTGATFIRFERKG